MKKAVLEFLYMVITVALFCTCATVKKADFSQNVYSQNIIEYTSISAELVNHSHFKVVVMQDFLSATSDAEILPGDNKLITIDVPENSKHDLFYKYQIPLTKNETITLEDFSWHLTLDMNANSFSLEIPEIKYFSDKTDYYIIYNDSKKPIKLIGQSNIAYKTIAEKDTLYPSESGVYSSSENSFISFLPPSILCNTKKYVLPVEDKKSGYVYTFSFDGNSLKMKDSRPLLAVGEETWEATFAENVSVCKMLRRPDSDALYFAGTETALDAKGFPFLRGVAGRIEISNSGAESALEEFRFAPFDVDGDAQFFDAMLLDSGELVAVGQISAEEPHGIIARYTEEGAASDFALSEETIALGALCGSTDGSSFFAGGIDSDGNIVVMSVSCGTSFVRRKIAALPIIASETADGIRFCYSATEDFILLAVNIKDADGFPLSRLYKISSNGGAMDEINLKGKISEVSSIVLNQNNTAILTGETFSGTKATACILTVQLDEQSCETQFISPNAPSWISDACFSESSDELILCGMTVFGKNRVPFMRAFNAHDFQPTWEQTYSAPTFKGLNDAAFFVPCADYGFLVGISALDADNNRRAPFKIVRVTSTGKTSEHHETIQIKGVEK